MRALVIDQVHPAGIRLLEQYLDVTHLPDPPSSAALGDIIGDYDALLMRVTPRIDEETLRAPGRLRVISLASVGLDHVNLAAAAARGIKVVNQPGVNRNAVAEFTFGLMLCLSRMIPQAAEQMRQGIWSRNAFQHGVELSGRQLGIIGFGHTGSRVAEIARGFHMRVLCYSPFSSDRRAQELGVRLAALDELLSESDFVSIHCPLTPTTVNMIGAAELALMRPGSYLLNLARGGIVDEHALYEALRTGHLAGAACDVFAAEPPGTAPLTQLPNFIGTPHVAGPTRDSLWRAGVRAAELVLHHLGINPSEIQSFLAAQASM